MDNLLTIEVDGKEETMKVSKWLDHNPVALDMEKRKYECNSFRLEIQCVI